MSPQSRTRKKTAYTMTTQVEQKALGFFRRDVMIKNVPPWNTKYGSCTLPGTPTRIVFFGGMAGLSGQTDAYMCEITSSIPGKFGRETTAGFNWVQLTTKHQSTTAGTTDPLLENQLPPPKPRIFPLMAALSPTRFLVFGGASLVSPYSTFTDAYMCTISFPSLSTEPPYAIWSRLKMPSLNSEFVYTNPDHAPLSTTSAFLRTLDDEIIIVTPLSHSAAPTGKTDPRRQSIVVTRIQPGDFEATDFEPSVSYGIYDVVAEAGKWPCNALQSVRLAALSAGYAVGIVVPCSKDSAKSIEPNTWLLSVTKDTIASDPSMRFTNGVADPTLPPFKFQWTLLPSSPNTPLLRSGMLLFSTGARLEPKSKSAVIAVYGGSNVWGVETVGSTTVPLHVAKFSKVGGITFEWLPSKEIHKNSVSRPFLTLVPDADMPASEITQPAPTAATASSVQQYQFLYHGGFQRKKEGITASVVTFWV